MITNKEIAKYPIKKCKNFGYTFSVLFLLVFFYCYINNKILNLTLIYVPLILTLITFFQPKFLKVFSIIWDKFGQILGKIFSPLILFFVYFITVIPINLVIRTLSVDLLKKKVRKKNSTYWIKRKKYKINFKNQF